MISFRKFVESTDTIEEIMKFANWVFWDIQNDCFDLRNIIHLYVYKHDSDPYKVLIKTLRHDRVSVQIKNPVKAIGIEDASKEIKTIIDRQCTLKRSDDKLKLMPWGHHLHDFDEYYVYFEGSQDPLETPDEEQLTEFIREHFSVGQYITNFTLPLKDYLKTTEHDIRINIYIAQKVRKIENMDSSNKEQYKEWINFLMSIDFQESYIKWMVEQYKKGNYNVDARIFIKHMLEMHEESGTL